MTNALILCKFLFSYSKHYHVLQLLQPQPLTSRACRPKKEMESIQEETFPAPEHYLLIHKERIPKIQPLSFPQRFSQMLNKKRGRVFGGIPARGTWCQVQPSVFLQVNQSSLSRITEAVTSLARNCGMKRGVSYRLSPD